MDRLLEHLNQAQRDAVQHVEGPMLVLAGPGSGKTRVVTHRIAHLIREGVPASHILALTFTNKAAEEMKKRVEELTPGGRTWVSTFHRFGARLLREHAEYVGLTPNFTIYDSSDAKQTLKRVIEAGKFRTMHYSPERIGAAISSAKNKLVTADRYEPRTGSPLSHIVAEVYPAYQKRLLASSAVDFDDLLLHVANLLYTNAEVRATLDSRYRYVMVDEYQDTNHAQYVMLRALSVDYPNLAATGDPDQSIYGWRGADINNILQFESDFPTVNVVRLEQNYRSTPNVLRVADQLIRCNLRRKKKSLFTEQAEGAAVRLAQYTNQDDEAKQIGLSIAQQIASGKRTASDFAIFYRVNALSRSLERGLREAGVPYQMIRGQEFYQRKEIKDVLGYCQLINNPRDDQAVLRTINTPTRGIGRKTVDLISEYAYIHGLPLLDAAREAVQVQGLAARSAKKALGYVQLVDKLSKLAAGEMEEILGTILEETGYRKTLAESESEEDLNRLANIEELLTDARQFDEKNPGGGHLETYLENAWLVNETDDWQDDTDKVTMMTLHAAKGLEFPVVYLVAVEQGLLPHERSINDEDQMEEERRLAFVGITRAEQELQLSYAVHRDFRGQRRRTVPSPFLLELPREEMELIEPNNDSLGYPMDWDNFGEGGSERDESNSFDEYDQTATPVEATVELDESRPSLRVAAAQITTASKLSGKKEQVAPTIDPDSFRQGMTVVHPEHGPGKIVALSGVGDNRRATIRFATAGEKRYVLAYTPLRVAGK
ncbi:ATP-dependent helicase [Adhaeretor mobilis]|uniref:DNA 3'-5' helicase n=1 Tax=Adhaeretor mobilis TaxID=1930276 RepID=A0A517MW55_9BACT|nr:UvrD-helicase domain-containing protein [Adhaeretor mobilis]QDS99027.1 ATP-dependent DNA helicase PcrA [Adhaeretor mobilis]